MTMLRAFVAFCVVALAVVLQVTVFPHVAWDGIVPNLALLVVVGAALVRGPQFAAVVGYVAGRVRQDLKPTAGAVVLTVAASSFVGTSLFALSGLLLRDPVVDVSEMLRIILIAVVWDVLLTPFVLPPLMRLFARFNPQWAAS